MYVHSLKNFREEQKMVQNYLNEIGHIHWHLINLRSKQNGQKITLVYTNILQNTR